MGHRMALYLLYAPAMLLSWGLARLFTTYTTSHAWRDQYGKFNITFDKWCEDATPEVIDISLGIYVSILCFLGVLGYYLFLP